MIATSTSRSLRRLRNNIKRGIRKGIRLSGGVYKEIRLWSCLSYTPEQLKEHLENQFQEGMTWENWGSREGCWGIDHIYPRSKLFYDSADHPNLQKCWALKNLQPMWYEDNIAKGATTSDE